MTPNSGRLVRLEPLTLAHLPALEVVAFDPAIWRYFVAEPKTPEELRYWADKAIQQQQDGTVMPWVTISQAENKPVGATRFIDLDLRHRTVEIGNTWLAPAWHRTGINIEAKLLQLTYAFEELGLNRVAFKTHHENLQSQKAIAALGAQFEGVFRNHFVMPDGSFRHSHWFSITKEEWPNVKAKLQARLAKYATP